MYRFLVYIPASHRATSWHQSSQHFFALDDATPQGPCIPAVPTFGISIHVVGNEPRPRTKDRFHHLEHIQRFFLKSCCISGSALAISGRGFLNRNPSRRKRRWHCRTPRWISNCLSMKWESNLPSHRLPERPY